MRKEFHQEILPFVKAGRYRKETKRVRSPGEKALNSTFPSLPTFPPIPSPKLYLYISTDNKYTNIFTLPGKGEKRRTKKEQKVKI